MSLTNGRDEDQTRLAAQSRILGRHKSHIHLESGAQHVAHYFVHLHGGRELDAAPFCEDVGVSEAQSHGEAFLDGEAGPGVSDDAVEKSVSVVWQ